MEEFKEEDDDVKNSPPHNNDFQLHDVKPESVFIQKTDFTSGPENYSARTEQSIRTKQMFNSETCLATVSSCQDPTLAKDVTPTNISSASASAWGTAKAILSMDVSRNKMGKVESHHRNAGGEVSSTSNDSSKMEKGKEPIVYEADDSRSSSNRREDGRENFECISSSGIVSTVKRVRIYDSESEKLVGRKSSKRLNNGNFSFMNWVSSITNGLSRPHDGPVEALRHPSKRMKVVISPSSPSSIPDEERDHIGVSPGTKGFRSIFQSVYQSDNNVSNKFKYIDLRKEMDALKGTEGEKASKAAYNALHERSNFGQHSSFPDSCFNFEKENISAGPVTLVAPQENDIGLHDKALAASKRFNKHACQVKDSPSDAMDSCGALLAQSKHAFQNSLWITRLSRGVSNCLDLSAQHKLLYLEEAKKNRLIETPQQNSVSHTDSHDSVRIVTENYESKLQLTICSKYCKLSKSMASFFAQRLDALKHTKSSENHKFCLFCGMGDHSIWECSEVVETRLEQSLKSIAMCDIRRKASSFCILCFQLDHWAASCPNASSKGNSISFEAINGDFNFKSTANIKHENQSFINNAGSIMLQSEDKKDYHLVRIGSTVSRKESKAVEIDNVFCEEVRSHENESAGLRVDRVEDINTINTNKMKMTSCSSENELKKSESHLPTSVMDEPKGIFVAVRKLRLSRMDVLRWMKSGTPHYHLCGFFLRLKIGKLDKGMRAGYYVGCINGATCQSSISVCVGSSTYSITSPFISNQDFEEDELMAWWFQNLRDGIKMPSCEELNEKFQLRQSFGF